MVTPGREGGSRRKGENGLLAGEEVDGGSVAEATPSRRGIGYASVLCSYVGWVVLMLWETKCEGEVGKEESVLTSWLSRSFKGLNDGLPVGRKDGGCVDGPDSAVECIVVFAAVGRSGFVPYSSPFTPFGVLYFFFLLSSVWSFFCFVCFFFYNNNKNQMEKKDKETPSVTAKELQFEARRRERVPGS